MGQKTNIQWCDSSANISSGCDGCELWNEAGEKICYAGNMHETRWAHTLAKTHPQNYSPRFKDVRLIPGRLKKAINWKDLRGTSRPDKPWIPPEMPRLIFISDMADALSRDVPFEYLLHEVIEPMRQMPHIGMWLTKQAKRLEKFAKWLESEGETWPENLWPGVSVTSAKTLWRLDYLKTIPAARRFVSYEPTLGIINWRTRLDGIHMLIIGGESQQNAETEPSPFDIKECYAAIEACREQGCEPFVKQCGANIVTTGIAGPGEQWPKETFFEDTGKGFWRVHLDDPRHGGEWEQWPQALRIREFPSAEVAASCTN